MNTQNNFDMKSIRKASTHLLVWKICFCCNWKKLSPQHRSVQTLLQLFYTKAKITKTKLVKHSAPGYSRWYSIQLLSTTHRSANILFSGNINKDFRWKFMVLLFASTRARARSSRQLHLESYIAAKTQRAKLRLSYCGNIWWRIWGGRKTNDGRRRRRRKRRKLFDTNALEGDFSYHLV